MEMRTTLALVVSAASLFQGSVLMAGPFESPSFETTPGDILVTGVDSSSPNNVPLILRYGPEVRAGEALSLGGSIDHGVPFVAPTSDDVCYIANGLLSPQVFKVNGQTGESEFLFSVGGNTTSGLVYDSDDDVVYAFRTVSQLGSQLIAFGPDDVFTPTTLFVYEDFNLFAPEGTVGILWNLSIDDQKNMYMRTDPVAGFNPSDNSFEQIARIDSKTGELSILTDPSGQPIEFDLGISHLAVLPDGRVIVNSAPHISPGSFVSFWIVEKNGTVSELFNNQDQPFPDGQVMTKIEFAAESNDTIVFILSESGGNFSSICRYSISKDEFSIVSPLPNGLVSTADSFIDIRVVPGMKAGAPLYSENSGDPASLQAELPAYTK